MARVSFTGKDTLKINGRILNDLPHGDVVTVEYPEDFMSIQIGKEGNAIYAYRPMGKRCNVTVRLLRGGADDKFMNNLLALMENDPSAFTFLQAEFIKNIGDGAGNIVGDTYILPGGVFMRKPGVKENADGDPEQNTVEYQLAFSGGTRAIA